MIHVQREQTDKAGKKIQPNSAWFQLAVDGTGRAIEEQDQHKANREIYAHDQLKNALECLFHDKCAYCELKVLEGWEVDHFRPRGAVAEREDHPGYYWLTYVWENLYPSCQHCNQHRREKPRWAGQAALGAGGKAAQFPLLDERSRAMGHTEDIHAERPLLLDPCLDDPEDYLGYDPKGHVFSLDDPNGTKADDIGSNTIKVLFLDRKRLRVRREETIQFVTGLAKAISNSIAEARALTACQSMLETMQGAGSQHAGLARYIVRHSSEFGA